MACIYFCGLILFTIPILFYALYDFISEERRKNRLKKWKRSPKDQVILHGYVQGKTLPNCSPFSFKVETYLRLAQIQYRVDKEDMHDLQGKSPWISLNGNHIGESELVIEHLNEVFEKDLNKGCTEIDIAHAQILRLMLEEYFVWTLDLRKTGGLVPCPFSWCKRKMTQKLMLSMLTYKEVTHRMRKILKNVSIALGNRKYFGGEQMCLEDCGIFAVLSQCVWGCTRYNEFLNEECKNLKEYCYRIKEEVYPDWDTLLVRGF